MPADVFLFWSEHPPRRFSIALLNTGKMAFGGRQMYPGWMPAKWLVSFTKRPASL